MSGARQARTRASRHLCPYQHTTTCLYKQTDIANSETVKQQTRAQSYTKKSARQMNSETSRQADNPARAQTCLEVEKLTESQTCQREQLRAIHLSILAARLVLCLSERPSLQSRVSPTGRLATRLGTSAVLSPTIFETKAAVRLLQWFPL